MGVLKRKETMSTIRVSISDNHPKATPDRWGFNVEPAYFWYERDMSDGSRIIYIHPLASPQTLITITMSKEEVVLADARKEAE